MAGGMAGPGGARGGSGSNSNSGSTAGNTGASAANSAASSASGMSIGFGGGLSGFSNSDQGGAGGWTSNSFGNGVNATGSGTSVSSGSGSNSSNGQTFGEQITSGAGENTGPSPADIEAQFKEEARKKTADEAKEARENEENGPNAIQNRLSVATTLSDTAKDSISRPNIALGPLRVGVANIDKISKEADNARKGALQAAQNVINNGGSLEDALNAYSNSYNTAYVHGDTLVGDRQAIENAFGAMKAAPSISSVTTTADTTTADSTATAIGNLGTLSFTGLLNSFAPPAESNEGANEQAQSSSGLTNRGSTVSTYGTGGSISSGLSAPERDTESIGLGVYDPDKANYDQDNWNRGMEQQSSSVVSDEQCKQFAMRAFHEDSPAFKVVKTTIIKKLD